MASYNLFSEISVWIHIWNCKLSGISCLPNVCQVQWKHWTQKTLLYWGHCFGNLHHLLWIPKICSQQNDILGHIILFEVVEIWCPNIFNEQKRWIFCEQFLKVFDRSVGCCSVGCWQWINALLVCRKTYSDFGCCRLCCQPWVLFG